MNSKPAFLSALDDHEVSDLKSKFEENGWDTFANFGFSCWEVKGQSNEAFETKVLPALADASKDNEKKYLPRLRRLYALSWIHCQSGMEQQATMESKPDEKLVMHSADHTTRLKALRDRMVGFSVTMHNHPSKHLIDLMHNILAKGIVKYVPWELCTSHDQQLVAEPKVIGLQVGVDGRLFQETEKDLRTEFSGEMLWDFALRRRACAADVAGLATFEAINLWTETMKDHLLRAAPPGYRKITWSQLQAADQALWRFVSEKTEGKTKKAAGAARTDFEVKWREGMFDPEVRQLLMCLPGSASSSSGHSTSANTSTLALAVQGKPDDSLAKEVRRLSNMMKQKDQQIAAQKRKLEKGGGKGGGIQDNKRQKGGGMKGRQGQGRARVLRWPAHEDACQRAHLLRLPRAGLQACQAGRALPKRHALLPQV